MRWSIIRLIWLRELRDQLRERRTLFMIVVLPLLLYPVLGYLVLQFGIGLATKPSVIGIVCGAQEGSDFPRRSPHSSKSPVSHLAWLATAPCGNIFSGYSLAQASAQTLEYPLLLRNGHFTVFDSRLASEHLVLVIAKAKVRVVPLRRCDLEVLNQCKVDLVVEASDDFFPQLELDTYSQSRPSLLVHLRPGDERSRQAQKRLEPLLEAWKQDLHKVSLARRGIPAGIAEPFDLIDANAAKAAAAPLDESIFDMVVRIFPFVLVMWSLAGALYPAVDLCAGEKERGT